LTDSDTARPSFFTERPGRYTFELTVREATLESSIDEVDVVVLDPEIGTRYDPASGCMHALIPTTTTWLVGLGALWCVGRRRLSGPAQ
jgi:hypothetical protein